MSTLLRFFTCLCLLQSSRANFQCYDRLSGLLTTPNDDVWTHCGQPMTDGKTYSGLTLVSCGVVTRDATEANVQGAFSLQNTAANNRQQCYAVNGANSAGVYSRARCCDFTHLGDVTSIGQDTAAVVGDDVKRTATCGTSSHVHLTGCHSFSYAFTNDGAYPGSSDEYNPAITAKVSGIDYAWDGRSCTVAAGASTDTFGNYVCVDSPSFALQCKLRYSPVSAGGTSATTTSVTCGAGYAMVGCSGYGLYKTLNSWWIDGNVCYARARNTQGVYAIATCCRLETSAPTPEPTPSPTPAPTAQPTPAPTSNPTNQPSAAPTSTRAPTTPPTTPIPTTSPTSTTLAPTATPTFAPSARPTVATRDPTTAPVVPTPRPTEGPTRATRDPTVAPSVGGRGGQFNEEADSGNNEALYLALFLVMLTLFCCAILGLCYYFYRKNNKQRDEVQRNNAGHVVVAGSSSVESPSEHDEADVAIAHAMAAEGANTTAVDASDGYRSTTGQVTAGSVSPAPGGDAGEVQTMMDQQDVPDFPVAASSGNGVGIDGMSDEDDEKSDIYRVKM